VEHLVFQFVKCLTDSYVAISSDDRINQSRAEINQVHRKRIEKETQKRAQKQRHEKLQEEYGLYKIKFINSVLASMHENIRQKIMGLVIHDLKEQPILGRSIIHEIEQTGQASVRSLNYFILKLREEGGDISSMLSFDEFVSSLRC